MTRDFVLTTRLCANYQRLCADYFGMTRDFVQEIQLGMKFTTNSATGKCLSELLFGLKLMSISESILGNIINDVTIYSQEDLVKLRTEARDKMESQKKKKNYQV